MCYMLHQKHHRGEQGQGVNEQLGDQILKFFLARSYKKIIFF